MKPLIYVAGPITSDPFGCVRAAMELFRPLRRAGAVPFLPQLSIVAEIVEHQPYEEWMTYDFDVLDHCHGLIRLPGVSPGADREVQHMEAAGKPVFIVSSPPFVDLEWRICRWLHAEWPERGR